MKGRWNIFIFFSMARKLWITGLSFFLTGFLVFSLFSFFMLGSRVTVSSSILLVSTLQTDGSLEAEREKSVRIQEVLQDSIVLIESQAMAEKALKANREDLPADSPKIKISAKRINHSNAITITVTGANTGQTVEFSRVLLQTVCNEIEKKYATFVTATLLDSPLAPTSTQRFSTAALHGAIGMVLGLLLFSAFLFFKMIRRDLVYNYSKYCQGTGIRFLGTVKTSECSRAQEDNEETRESLHTVCAAIKAAAGADKRIILCSAGPREGRSMVASGVAKAVAQSGARVLLMDANMRTAHPRARLRVSAKFGLADVLRHSVPLDQAIISAAGGLDVLCANVEEVENPSSLLDNAAVNALLDAVTPKYDYIFIDTPAVNRYADTAVLARLCSGCVLVALAGKSRIRSENTALSILSNVGAKVYGLVSVESENKK